MPCSTIGPCDLSARPRGRLGRAGAAVFHEPRAGPAQGLRVVVGADDRGGTRRPGDVAAPPHRGGDRRGKILARALPAGAGTAAPNRVPAAAVRRVSHRLQGSERVARSRAREAGRGTRSLCRAGRARWPGHRRVETRPQGRPHRDHLDLPSDWAAPMPVWWRRRRAGTGTFWARMS